jgi:uncharacterized protein
MSQAIYVAGVESCAASLGSLAEILAKAAAHEGAATLPQARLAPDMFPLATQVQFACYQAAGGVKRLMGGEAGRPDIQEASLAEMQTLIAETLAAFAKLTPGDFAGAEDRRIVMPLQPPMVLDIDGVHFLHRWMLPNFYFHVVTAYDILRHNGLEIGKKDYLSHLAGYFRQTA